MDVYLVRHAVAEQRDVDRWPDDSLRPLTADGEERFRRAARGLGKLVPTVDEVLSSGYPRAWRTAELLHEEAGWPEPRECPELEASRAAADALGLLRGRESPSVALVGHEPYLSSLASLLVTGDPWRLRLELKKGAAALVTFEPEEGPGSAWLRWSASPRILRGLA